MIRARRDDPDADAVVGVRAGEVVDDVERLPPGEVGCDLRAKPVEVVLVDRMVDLAPPDPVARAGLVHDELVVRRAAREAPRVHHQRAAVRQAPVTARERARVELSRRRVVNDPTARQDAVPIEGLFADRCHGAVRSFRSTGRSLRPCGKVPNPLVERLSDGRTSLQCVESEATSRGMM